MGHVGIELLLRHALAGARGHGLDHLLDDLHGPLHEGDFLGALDGPDFLHETRGIHQLGLGKCLSEQLHRGVRHDAVRGADQPGESREAQAALIESQLPEPCDGVLGPSVAAVPDVFDPVLNLLPPVGPVEDIGGYGSLGGKDREHLRGESADAREVAGVRHGLLPTAGVGRQQEDIQSLRGHLFPHELVSTVSFGKGDLRNEVSFRHGSLFQCRYAPWMALRAIGVSEQRIIDSSYRLSTEASRGRV